jgi:hypothetical protein
MNENGSIQARRASDIFSALDHLILFDDIHPTLSDVEGRLAPLALAQG